MNLTSSNDAHDRQISVIRVTTSTAAISIWLASICLIVTIPKYWFVGISLAAFFLTGGFIFRQTLLGRRPPAWAIFFKGAFLISAFGVIGAHIALWNTLNDATFQWGYVIISATLLMVWSWVRSEPYS